MNVSIALGFMISLISTSVSAESIRWKPETLKSGDYTSINQSQGGLIHHVFRGKVGMGDVDEFLHLHDVFSHGCLVSIFQDDLLCPS